MKRIFKSIVSALLVNPLIVRLISFFCPHRFEISFYLSSFLSSYILPKNSAFEIVNGYGSGLKMALRIGDKLNPQETHYWLGFHEPKVQRVFSREIRTGFVIYDIGAYIGFYSLLACRLTGSKGKVYAFEPWPINIEKIRLNILLNRMQDRVFCIPRAVSDKSGRVRYQTFVRDDWGRFLNVDSLEEKDSDYTNLLFETISLDDFVFKEAYPAPNLIKIDTEGGEAKVLAGAQRLLKEYKPIVICELHIPEIAMQVYETLINFGYRFEDLKGRETKSIVNRSHVLARPIEIT